MGGREGGRLWPRRADVAGAALGAGATGLCVATVPEGSRTAARVLDDAHPRHGPRRKSRGRPRPRRAPRARRLAGGHARRRSRAPEARHRDGTLGPLGAAGAAGRRRRPDEPSRDGGHRRRVYRVADRALPLGDAPVLASHPPHREQRGALRYPSARFDAARCGIALYGLSPFGTDPAEDGLEPVLSWTSHSHRHACSAPVESTGYGRRFIAEQRHVDRDRAGRAMPTGSGAI